MRRALLVASLAAPAIALAQPVPDPGDLREVDTFDVESGNSYINAAHCAAADAGRVPVHLEWNILGANVLSTGTYRIFATNKQPTVADGQALAFCAEEPVTGGGTGDTRAAQVASVTPDDELQDLFLPNETITTTAADIVAAAGRACTAANENQPVYMCVHYYEGPTTRVGSATGTFIVQLAAPIAPSGVVVETGDTRLEVRWEPISTGTVAERYIAEARPLAPGSNEPAADAPVISSPEVAGRTATISGLTNGTRYSVVVKGISVGGNVGPASEARIETPEVIDDFWDTYTREQGREQGGCGSGPAGAFALLGVAGLLAALRRRS